ncbi:MAG: alanyl-tRNA synthetase [Chthoniobacter sp.]|nr:alanyl-tRNA synthetase [Chthoniobacter sp.]
MTSAEIRQSFLDFFREKRHTIVPSSSLMPDSPNLLFTNAGMNQFVPIFLGETRCPYSPGRAADTQKCIRAGGKHNDLDDVGLDTYHHTFFEMLGNWSFGDYFKREAIEWAWELVVGRWKFPANRLYATVYSPDKALGDPSDFDQEAHDLWAEKFRAAGLDPAVHIVNGTKKDNFWMMGDTGPCGPCSELHVDLTQNGDTGGALVNKGSSECIEIWNLVFIQFNANPDGTFTPLPAQHVDTGMGFERVTSIMQCTKNFTDFGTTISNYETDVFRPIFEEIEKLSGKKYASTLPSNDELSRFEHLSLLPREVIAGEIGVLDEREKKIVFSHLGIDGGSPKTLTDVARKFGVTQEQIDEIAAASFKKISASYKQRQNADLAFRVIADHIRTLSFAIADGIQPGNTDRNYVLRRILRRAVRYGRTLGFHEPFFYKLVAVLARTMGDVFPEIRAKQKHVEETLRREEEAFNKTLDRGLSIFDNKAYFGAVQRLASKRGIIFGGGADFGLISDSEGEKRPLETTSVAFQKGDHFIDFTFEQFLAGEWRTLLLGSPEVSGKHAFELYDTYGFPLDLTELMARERGLTVDTVGFEKLMEEQRARARAAQKKQVIELSQIETKEPTHFLGYDHNHTGADVQEVVALKDKTAVVLNNSVCYAEMGGQVGDTGELTGSGKLWRVVNTQKSGATWLHFIESDDAPSPGEHVTVEFDAARRAAIQRHHTVTHLLHWALHEIVSREATQKGSFVGPDKLTFDFNSAALTPAQVRDVERLVNERIVENAGVTWNEVAYADVRGRADVMQFFGDKYGETVRLVEVGDYSKELCGGTHTRATGEIGLFRIVSEAAIAAGVRRIEAVAGLNAYDFATTDTERLKNFATKLNAPIGEIEKKLEALLAQQKELEKSLKSAQQREAAGRAKTLLASAETINGTPAIIEKVDGASGDDLQTIADALKSHGFKGVIVLGVAANGAVALVASVSPDFTAKAQAGKIIQQIAPLVGGKGGGKPDNARGGGKDPSQLDAALAHAKTLL